MQEASYILGLDVSTFCTGFSIWDLEKDKLSKSGFIPLKHLNGWHAKVDAVCSILEDIKKNTNKITYIAIEDILQKFIAGKVILKPL